MISSILATFTSICSFGKWLKRKLLFHRTLPNISWRDVFPKCLESDRNWRQLVEQNGRHCEVFVAFFHLSQSHRLLIRFLQVAISLQFQVNTVLVSCSKMTIAWNIARVNRCFLPFYMKAIIASHDWIAFLECWVNQEWISVFMVDVVTVVGLARHSQWWNIHDFMSVRYFSLA